MDRVKKTDHGKGHRKNGVTERDERKIIADFGFMCCGAVQLIAKMMKIMIGVELNAIPIYPGLMRGALTS